jgi:hypothetical protein
MAARRGMAAGREGLRVMNNPLYDHELDGNPPMVGAGPVAPGWEPKASAISGKKFAEVLRDHPFVVWVVGLSLPRLLAVGIAAGVLVSIPLVFLVQPDRRAFALLMALLGPASISWAVGGRQSAPRPASLGRRPPRPKRVPPARVKKPPHLRPEDGGWLGLFDRPDAITDPRYLWLAGSIRRKVLWCLSMPFLVYVLTRFCLTGHPFDLTVLASTDRGRPGAIPRS